MSNYIKKEFLKEILDTCVETVNAEIEYNESGKTGNATLEVARQKSYFEGKLKVLEALYLLVEEEPTSWNPADVEDMNSVRFVWELEDYDLDDVIMTMEEEGLSFVEAYRQLLHLEETIKETEREREDY